RAFVKLLRFIHPAEGRKVGTLLIVHIDRASARGHVTSDDGYAGSAQWHNSCRRRMYLKVKQERADGTDEVVSETTTLEVHKNQDGPLAAPMEVMRDESGFWMPAGVQIQLQLPGAPPREDPAKVLLRLMDEYYQRGQWITATYASNSTTDVYST